MSGYPVQATASHIKIWAAAVPTPPNSIPITVGGSAFTGTISATGNTDDFDISEVSTGFLAASVGTPTGTSPNITFSLQIKDVMGNYYQAVALTALTAAGTQSASVGPGTTNQVVLTNLARIRWVVTGTNPSFPSVGFAFHGR